MMIDSEALGMTRQVIVALEALGDVFYTPGKLVVRQEIERRGSFNLIHLATMFKIDIFLTGARPGRSGRQCGLRRFNRFA